MQHQMMGYDRTSTMFSPDGRLLQVEYAKKAVKQGIPAMGVVCKDGVLLVADRRVAEPLIITKSLEKVSQVDEHIGVTSTGYVMDGRILIERARLIAQQHRVTYDSPVNVLEIEKNICDIKQNFTQFGGARPFGVSLLFAGINSEKELYVTDPTGIFFQYKATAIGENENEIKDFLNKNYKESMDLSSGLKLALKALKKVQGKEFDISRIDASYINDTEKKFRRYSQEDLRKVKW